MFSYVEEDFNCTFIEENARVIYVAGASVVCVCDARSAVRCAVCDAHERCRSLTPHASNRSQNQNYGGRIIQVLELHSTQQVLLDEIFRTSLCIGQHNK